MAFESMAVILSETNAHRLIEAILAGPKSVFLMEHVCYWLLGKDKTQPILDCIWSPADLSPFLSGCHKMVRGTMAHWSQDYCLSQECANTQR